MSGPICILGRQFEPEELTQLQRWIDQRHGQSRRALSVGLAELWDWRNDHGQLRDMAVRLLLNRLEQRVGLRLPARQNRGGRRQARPSSQAALTPSGPITQPLRQLQPVSVHLVGPRQAERARVAQYFLAHHYLGYPHPLGQLHYLVTDGQGRDLALLLFGPAAWKCAPRDRFIGWSAAQRQAHLQQVANNSRFLILPWVEAPRLASHVLSLVLRRLPQDWQSAYARPLELVETFVDTSRFTGACYRAANWIELGQTTGRTLQAVARPDHTVIHRLERCPCGQCGGCSLQQAPVLGHEKRQVFELPQKPLEVTEHQAEIKRCPVSGLEVRASFPERVIAPAQYGPRFRAPMVYLNQQQGLPYERLTQLCQDFYGQPLSEATVASANERTYQQLAPFEQRLQVLLPQAPANLDESGGRVAGKLHWVPVVSTPQLTFYGVHPKRGREAMDQFEIVPRCRHFVIHDHFKPYFGYTQCLHALCNEHHLRELKFVFEQEHEPWAGQMSRFLLDCLARRKQEGVLEERQFQKVRRQYRAILKQGRWLHPRVQGGGAQSKAANLLRRLEDFEWNVLAFTVFEEVPFTNNGAHAARGMSPIMPPPGLCRAGLSDLDFSGRCGKQLVVGAAYL